ncbi:hypothetical protein [Microbispora sp. ATCC PTA-5024]|uniref:hypothetical protein n=1 Tax=Microbispora sp. ATCC PTA-5024 TaxID=316330 RepID=UPI0003DC8108|nr:hypothetical protein [Microbispora sp. ATCC PTA-5024]ETK34807.1 hypothetical protein MPTA5024_17385 [Microbispora sp. ATCC PTA-5024]
MSRPGGDPAGRLLAFALWLLPAARYDWGLAMRAELAHLDRPAARLRFALGCVRAAAVQPPALRGLALSAGVAGAVTLLLAGGVTHPEARLELTGLLSVVVLLAWRGGRPGLLGPVRPSRTARVVRTTGFAVACAYLLVAFLDHRGPQPLGSGDGLLPGMITLVLYLVATLAVTARGSTARSVTLMSGIVAGLVAGPVCFTLMPFERALPPLAEHLPGHGVGMIAALVAAPAAAMIAVALSTRDALQAVVALVCAGAVCAGVVAVLGYGAFLLLPDQMPSLVPLNAGPPDVRRALSRLEAGDEYVAALIWGCLLVGVLSSLIPPALRGRTRVLRAATITSACLALLAAPTGHLDAAVAAVLAATTTGMLTLVGAEHDLRRSGTATARITSSR